MSHTIMLCKWPQKKSSLIHGCTVTSEGTLVKWCRYCTPPPFFPTAKCSDLATQIQERVVRLVKIPSKKKKKKFALVTVSDIGKTCHKGNKQSLDHPTKCTS